MFSSTTGAASGDRILFLHLTMVDFGVRLDSSSTVPGHVKAPRRVEAYPERLHFAAKNRSGDLVFEGITTNPTRVRH